MTMIRLAIVLTLLPTVALAQTRTYRDALGREVAPTRRHQATPRRSPMRWDVSAGAATATSRSMTLLEGRSGPSPMADAHKTPTSTTGTDRRTVRSRRTRPDPVAF